MVMAAAFAGWGFEYPYFPVRGLLVGVVQAILYAAYLRALIAEEASRVPSLIFVYPVFVFLGSALLLGEVLSPRRYAGGLILVASALLVSRRPAGSLASSSSPSSSSGCARHFTP
jgi:drug/metabolite transporter (DMT)-like permease